MQGIVAKTQKCLKTKPEKHTYRNQQDYDRAGTSSSFPQDTAAAAARSPRRRIGPPPSRTDGPPYARGQRTAGAWLPPPSALAALKGEVNILFASILNYPAHWKEDIVRLKFFLFWFTDIFFIITINNVEIAQ